MTNPPAPLHLAPRLKRPLQWWNPFDYLRLLYWALFFPQALRWYKDTFAGPLRPRIKASIWPDLSLWRDPVRRALLLQSSVLYLAVLLAFWFGMKTISAPFLNPLISLLSVGILLAWIHGVSAGKARGAVLSMARGMVVAASICIAFGVILGTPSLLVAGWSFIAYLVGSTASFDGKETLQFLAGAPKATVVLAALWALPAARILDWLLAWLLTPFPGGRFCSRAVWLPLPGLQRRLEAALEHDWQAGLRDVGQVLGFTFQSLPAVAATNAALARSPKDLLLPRAFQLANPSLHRDLLRFGSASLVNAVRQEAIDAILFVSPKRKARWKARYPTDLRLDTPAHCACAGLWLWSEGKAREAMEALAGARALPHGRELYSSAAALADALEVRDLDQLAAWNRSLAWLDELEEPELRPTTLGILRHLRQIAREAESAGSPAALVQAASELDHLLAPQSNEPALENPVVQQIADHWKELLQRPGGTSQDLSP